MDSLLVAVAAEWLIFVLLAQKHTLVVLHQSVAYVCQGTALHADGMHLGYLVGDGTESRNRTEGNSLEVHVEARHDDAYAAVGEFIADLHQTIVQELGLVDTDHVDVGSQQEYRSGRFNRSRSDRILIVAHYIVFGVTSVYRRL